MRIKFLIYFFVVVVCLFWNILLFFSKKIEFFFEFRLKLVRINFFFKKKLEFSSFEDLGVSSVGNSGVIRIDYNFFSGVIFRENKTFNV